jgi:putative protein-disulfide isomerase
MKASLIYVHDPMCSWCWGFEPIKHELFNIVSKTLHIQCLIGGLAPDSDQPMAKEMQLNLQNIWRQIEQTIPGTQFNYSFWRDCSPRRSTYPANRAVIAARVQDIKFDQLITNKIQQAYYLQARNPSDNSTLIEIAGEIGLDTKRFSTDLVSEETQKKLIDEINLVRSLGVNSFPSILISHEGKHHPIAINYTNIDEMLIQINKLVA